MTARMDGQEKRNIPTMEAAVKMPVTMVTA